VGGTWTGNGIQGNRFYPSLAGLGSSTIAYTVTNLFGCTAASAVQIQVNECPERHITLDKPNSIIVYSNPNNGRFNIWMRTDLYTRLSMRVFNSAGQLVRTETFSGLFYDKKQPVDLSLMAAGVYQLYLFNDENGQLVKKIVGIIISR
jgi:hypothetical protein